MPKMVSTGPMVLAWEHLTNSQKLKDFTKQYCRVPPTQGLQVTVAWENTTVWHKRLQMLNTYVLKIHKLMVGRDNIYGFWRIIR